MEELGEGLKGIATAQEEQEYQLTRPLRTPTTHVAEDCLIQHQWEGRFSPVELDAPEKGGARGARQEWVGALS